ncbi:MAG: methionine--tRNA ligase [Sphingomonadales bacterium]
MSGTPFYITTAISYPNGRPHIGHAYEAIAADTIARFQRMQGREVRFQTGTDEHGLKMVQTARDKGVEVRDLAREMSDQFQAMCDALNVSYDHFQRTTDPAHHRASVAIWEAMKAKDDLYLDRYEGWYSVRDEAFYEEKELTESEGGQRLSPQGTPVEWTVEESWFFKLSKYEKPLLELYEHERNFIQPDSRRNEVIRFVEGGLRDLSISRTSFDWGVKVPGSPDHVMYVWVDALTNYLTGLGYPDATPEMAKFWPADLHLIGKDIVRFHAVYWPAFLMSADIALPKAVFGHGFLLARDGAKMSKSAGNVVDPMALAERYGVDAFRYFLMREVSFGQDGTWSEEAIVTCCNADLANNFGNLAQRVLSMIFKNLDGVLPNYEGVKVAEDTDTFMLVQATCTTAFPTTFNELGISNALQGWFMTASACNRYMDFTAPWALKKTDPEAMATVLGILFVAIAHLAVVISPVIPEAANKLLDQMGMPKDKRNQKGIATLDWYADLASSDFRLGAPTPIFPRLELPAAVEA